MANQTRRDSKGRVLRNGEYQRADGKYEYRYIDPRGESKSIYSWQLVETDAVPKGKQRTEPLREIIKRIQIDCYDGIASQHAKKTTLNECFDLYINNKPELALTTKANYLYMYNQYIRNGLGKKALGNIKYSDVKKLYNDLIYSGKLSMRTVEIVQTLLHPVFALAVKDELIRINPCSGIIAEMKKRRDWPENPRNVLTREEQEAFVRFYTSDQRKMYQRWVPILTFFLGTGVRCGEAIGLQWKNVDFENGLITIDHQLVYHIMPDGKCKWTYSLPKTKAGIRTIPMFPPVREMLEREFEWQQKHGFNSFSIDGEDGFVFMGRFGGVLSRVSINRAIKRIVDAYNEEEGRLAKEEKRKPLLLKHITVHCLRHTFCTRLVESGMNPKLIQDVMGHADVATTFDTYSHISDNYKKKTFESFSGIVGNIG